MEWQGERNGMTVRMKWKIKWMINDKTRRIYFQSEMADVTNVAIILLYVCRERAALLFFQLGFLT